MKMATPESRFSALRQSHLWTLASASFFFILFIVYGHSGVAPVGETKAGVEAAVTTAPMSESRNSDGSEGEPVFTRNGKVGRRDTFYDILTAQGLSPRVVTEVVAAAKPVFDLGRIRVGNAYRLGFNGGGELLFLEYEIDEQRFVRVEKSGGAFRAEPGEIDYMVREGTVSVIIDSSLYNAIVGEGESPMLAIQLAEIFAWDIDFNTDLRKGNRFNLVIEKKYRDGKYVSDGRILAAEFINGERAFRAIYFEDGSSLEGYYTDEGKSLRKQFLKAPLRYSYVSSSYTRRRLHPILKKYMPHQGVDYAAPRGTPVVAIGDGRVIRAGRKGWNGILVKLKHKGTYTSSYGHLSRLGKGIKRGVRVKQGQVIGYVGSTGRATGPHLDFRIRKNDKYVNPLKLEMPPARNVSREEFKAFAVLRDRMISRLAEAGGIMSAKREEGVKN